MFILENTNIYTCTFIHVLYLTVFSDISYCLVTCIFFKTALKMLSILKSAIQINVNVKERSVLILSFIEWIVKGCLSENLIVGLNCIIFTFQILVIEVKFILVSQW